LQLNILFAINKRNFQVYLHLHELSRKLLTEIHGCVGTLEVRHRVPMPPR